MPPLPATSLAKRNLWQPRYYSGKKQSELPEAYLQLIAKDGSGKIVSSQTSKPAKASLGTWQELEIIYQAKTNETVEVSVVNSSARVSALFDDLALTTERTLSVSILGGPQAVAF